VRPFAELRAHAGYSTVRDDLIEFEARLLGLGPLVLDGLLGAADARVKDSGHGVLTSPLGLRPLIRRPLTLSTLTDSHSIGVQWPHDVALSSVR